MRDHAAPTWAGRWRWLALAGAVLAFYAVWAPWAIAVALGPFAVPNQGLFYCYLLNLSPSALVCYAPMFNAGPLFGPIPVAWLTPLGLLVVPFLWSQRFRALAAGLLALWWLYVTATLLVAAAAFLPWLASGQAQLVLTNTAPRVGALAAILGLSVGWLAEIRLLRDALRQVRVQGWPSVIPRVPRRGVPGDGSAAVRALSGLIRGGAGVLTAGLLVWVFSLLAQPWALGTCPQSTPVGSACPGLSAGLAMMAGAFPAQAWINPATFQLAIPVLLVGASALAIFAAWRLPVNARLCGWLAVWLAAATAATALGIIGAAAVVAGTSPIALDHPTPYSGYFLGEIGLALAWLGLVPLVVAAAFGQSASHTVQ